MYVLAHLVNQSFMKSHWHFIHPTTIGLLKGLLPQYYMYQPTEAKVLIHKSCWENSLVDTIECFLSSLFKIYIQILKQKIIVFSPFQYCQMAPNQPKSHILFNTKWLTTGHISNVFARSSLLLNALLFSAEHCQRENVRGPIGHLPRVSAALRHWCLPHGRWWGQHALLQYQCRNPQPSGPPW